MTRTAGKISSLTRNILLLVFLFLLGSNLAFSQELKFAAKASLGTGSINSKMLQSYFDSENASDADIKRYDLNARLGFAFSVGGVVEYPISDMLSLIAEPGISHQSSNLQIDYMEDDSQSGLTFRNSIESNNTIKLFSVSSPILIRYYLGADGGLYLTTGLKFDFVLSSKIEAEEEIVEQDIDPSGIVTQTNSSTKVNNAEFDSFGSPRTAFSIGVGKTLNTGSSGITLDLRYNLGLTRSNMFTNNSAFASNTENSDVFTSLEQADIAVNDGFVLDDFKNSSLQLTIGYRF